MPANWPNNQWYVAGWDYEIDQTPLARTICREPVMLYRRFDRSIVAMRDACPHRLLPLSLGTKEGDNIRCRYHGLLINSDGQGIEMPMKHDPVARSACVQTYPVVEQHRFVWIWIGDAAKADPALIPNFWPCSHPDWAFDGGYYRIACDYRLMIDNIMDLSHQTHVHPGSIGQSQVGETPIENASDGNEVVVKRWMSDVEPPPFWHDALKRDGNVDRWQICQFIAPSSVAIDVGVAAVGAGASLESHDQGVRGFVIVSMTPETRVTCHYFWGMARNFDIGDAGFTARFKAQQASVFRLDLEVLEAQQVSIDCNPDLRLRSYNIDSGGVRARLLIDRMMKEQATSG